jgi:hypothetical protein
MPAVDLGSVGLMTIYGFHPQSLEIIDGGECDLASVLERFELCYDAGLQKSATGELAVASSSFGVWRSDSDFIEVACNGHESVAIHSDRLFFPSTLSRLFARKQRFSISGDRHLAISAITDYFALERDAFEIRYSKFICR